MRYAGKMGTVEQIACAMLVAKVQHMPPGLLTAAGEAWRRPIGRLHWAGSDTAQKWMGCVALVRL